VHGIHGSVVGSIGERNRAEKNVLEALQGAIPLPFSLSAPKTCLKKQQSTVS
jgi:hypothetical protein